MFPRFLSRLPMRVSNIVIRTIWFSQRVAFRVVWSLFGVHTKDVFQPQLGSTRAAVELPLHGRRHHVHLQELVELVRGDFGFVALPETAVDSRRQRSPGHPGDGPAGPQGAAHRFARIGALQAHALGGPQILLDLLIATDPDLCSRVPAWTPAVPERRRRTSTRGRSPLFASRIMNVSCANIGASGPRCPRGVLMKL